MDYEEAVGELLAIPRYKKKIDQVEIAYLLGLLGHPEEQLQMLHVAGTNGKGSVCAYLEQIGRSQGYSMGLFTSPHLLDIRERFQVNGELISREDFVRYYERVKKAAGQMEQDGHLPATFFEVIFSMAVCYFAEKKVDYAIVEAGMGGRSDTTNVIHPVISVIVAIGLDHTAILGSTLAEIAYEKAGIMKPGVPVVVSRQSQEVREILCRTAKEIGAPCHFTDEYGVRILKNTPQGIDFSVDCEYDSKRFHTGMCGNYQVENALTAIMAARVLWNLELSAMQVPIANMFWAGRMECVCPRCYVDGAHNPQAMQQFADTVLEYFKEVPKILLYAVASDKDDSGMLRELLRIGAHTMVVTELEGARKTSCDAVYELVKKQASELGVEIKVHVIADMRLAIEHVLGIQKKDEYVFCTGSLYLVSAVKERMKKDRSESELSRDREKEAVCHD